MIFFPKQKKPPFKRRTKKHPLRAKLKSPALMDKIIFFLYKMCIMIENALQQSLYFHHPYRIAVTDY